MEGKLLSICISSYCKGDRCKKLVEKLLMIRDERFDIYICDDGSDSRTVETLQSISDDLVKLKLYKENAGACKNWYRTIDCGTGKYVLHILDRDDIAVSSVRMLLDTLQRNEVGAGYVGKSALSDQSNVKIYKEGRDAVLAMGGIPVHPTGFFVNQKVWKEQHVKKYFYMDEKYGIYPHAYVLAKVAVKYPLMNIPIPFCSYSYAGTAQKSRFYDKSEKKNYWWLPKEIIRNANLLILYLTGVCDASYRDEYIIQRFRNSLYRSTVGYKLTVGSKKEMNHYGKNVKRVTAAEMVLISAENLLTMQALVKKLNMSSFSMRAKLCKCWMENLSNIVGNC